MTNNQVYNNQIITNNQKPINQTGSGIGYWNLGFIWSLGFGYWILFFMTLCLFASPAAQAAVGPNYIEQWGITWTFDKNISTDGAPGTYQYGQFVNGDYWVVGPVTIKSITPKSFTPMSTYTQGVDIFAAGRTVNGSMLNPTDAIDGIGAQGFDSAANYYNPADNVALMVDSEIPSTWLTIVVDNQTPIKSLTSAISQTAVGFIRLRSASVLTVVNSAPATGSFRPSYYGTKRHLTVAGLHNVSEMNLSHLAALAPVVGSPILATIERNFARVWIDHQRQGRGIHPTENMPEYGNEISSCTSMAALVLNLDYAGGNPGLDNAVLKRTLAINYIQCGIDLYGIVESSWQTNGPYQMWFGEGGQGPGRKLPILVAGLLLNDSGMKGIGAKSGDYRYYNNSSPYVERNRPIDYIHFGEDDQTFYVKAEDVLAAPYVIESQWPLISAGRATFTYGSTTVQGIGTSWDSSSVEKYIVIPNGIQAVSTTGDGYKYLITAVDVANQILTINKAYEEETVIGNDYRIGPYPGFGHHNYANKRDLEEYIAADIGLPEWGITYTSNILTAGKNIDANYRHTAGGCNIGTALAAQIMGLKTQWNNNAFFDYCDRYWAIMMDEGWVGGSNDPILMATNMWNAYRANYGPIWPDKYGDISGDSALSAYDAALCARIAVGLDAYPTGDNLTKADVSGDGFVTAYDAALIAQRAVGLIEKFPVG
jgi:hypothetical protein